MKKLTMLFAAIVLGGLIGCSSTTKVGDKITRESKVYSQTKGVYCGSSEVKSYYRSEDMITVGCDDGSFKTIFLDE